MLSCPQIWGHLLRSIFVLGEWQARLWSNSALGETGSSREPASLFFSRSCHIGTRGRIHRGGTPLTNEELELETTDAPSEAARAVLLQGIRALNEPVLGPSDSRPLGIIARSGGQLEGGLSGATGRGLLHVDMLWVRPERRGRGLGSRLLRAAEAEARARGCTGAWLDTFDFQARPFYERHGYAVFGELGGFVNGHVRCFMNKTF